MIFLRSRYYSPLTGTFISRDSWQGDYNRPLSLNRWTYVNGNPVNYTDPSGLFSSPYASFRGNSFREVDKIQIHYALVEVAKAYRRGYLEYLAYLDNYYSNIGCITSDLESIKYWLSLQFPTNSDTTIFLRIHSGPILFNEDGQDLGWWATTHSKNQINIHKGGFLSKYTTYQELDGTILYASRYEDFLSGKTVPGFDMQNWIDVTERYRHWVTHEVGHAFNNAIKDSSGAGKLPENTVTKWQNANKLPLPLSPYDEEGGFCGTKNEGWQWRLSDQNGPGEIFSDMFIGWVYNCFESSQRSDFMNENMPYWIFNAAKP